MDIVKLEREIIKALEQSVLEAGTQTELAKQAGISQGTIAKFMRGLQQPANMPIKTLAALFPKLVVDLNSGAERKIELVGMDAVKIDLLKKIEVMERAEVLDLLMYIEKR